MLTPASVLNGPVSEGDKIKCAPDPWKLDDSLAPSHHSFFSPSRYSNFHSGRTTGRLLVLFCPVQPRARDGISCDKWPSTCLISTAGDPNSGNLPLWSSPYKRLKVVLGPLTTNAGRAILLAPILTGHSGQQIHPLIWLDKSGPKLRPDNFLGQV